MLRKGKFQLDGFEIFESIRKIKKDGGTLVGVHKALKPMLIQEYNDEFELIVVEIAVSGKEIRIITGYGPQENWTEDEKMPFFTALEEEINKAEKLGKSIFLEMDANSKLGEEFIKNDPHSQSQNGRILARIIYSGRIARSEDRLILADLQILFHKTLKSYISSSSLPKFQFSSKIS